ncbi:hypothetical protein Btru_043530 [Bulinus truncatus]|nr:hypothetical protein Btru_043530 [Bulinus truncatus]
MEDRLTLSDKLEFELQTDILTLLENVKCQSSNSPVLKQALCALATICNTGSNAQDYFRTVGGVEILKDMLLNGDYSGPVISTTFFCLACAVNRNGKGQWLAYDTECLTDLINIMKNLLAVKCNEDDQWATIARAIEVCVNNPQNVTNQQVCCSLVPHMLKFITTNPDHMSMHHVLSLFCLVIANNALNQERIYQCGGVSILVNLLKWQRNTDQPQRDNMVTNTVAALDACISDNEKACRQAGDLGVIPLLLELLYDREHEQNYPLIVTLTLGHVLEYSQEHCSLVSQGEGYHLLVSYLTDTQDDELLKAIKYVFSLCKVEDSVKKIFSAHEEASPQASYLLENISQPCENAERNMASHECSCHFKLPVLYKTVPGDVICKSHNGNKVRNFNSLPSSSHLTDRGARTEQSKHLQPWQPKLKMKENLNNPNHGTVCPKCAGTVCPKCANQCDLEIENLNLTTQTGTSSCSDQSLRRKVKRTTLNCQKEHSNAQGKITLKNHSNHWPHTVPFHGKEKENIYLNSRHGDDDQSDIHLSNCVTEKVNNQRSKSEGQTLVELIEPESHVENMSQDRMIADIVQKMTATLFKSLADSFQPPSLFQQTAEAGLKDMHGKDELVDRQWQMPKVSSVQSLNIGPEHSLSNATHDSSAFHNYQACIQMLNSQSDKSTNILQGKKIHRTEVPESVAHRNLSPNKDCDALKQISTVKLNTQLNSQPAEEKEIFVKPKQPVGCHTTSKRTLPNIRISHKYNKGAEAEEEEEGCASHHSPPSPTLSAFDRFLWDKAKEGESVSVFELRQNLSGYSTTCENGQLNIVMQPSTGDIPSEKTMLSPANFIARKITVSLKEKTKDQKEKEHDVYSFVSDSEKKRRLRVPYSDDEVRNLLTGVAKMGKYWKQILCSYKFHPVRTSVDLKDKYKRLMAVQGRDKDH